MSAHECRAPAASDARARAVDRALAWFGYPRTRLLVLLVLLVLVMMPRGAAYVAVPPRLGPSEGPTCAPNASWATRATSPFGPGAILDVIGDSGSVHGIFDPCLVPRGAGGGSGAVYMSYSSVANTDGVHTRLAASADNGSSWSFVAAVNEAAPNTSYPCGAGGGVCVGALVHEVSSTVFDAADPDAGARWKLFTHTCVMFVCLVVRLFVCLRACVDMCVSPYCARARWRHMRTLHAGACGDIRALYPYIAPAHLACVPPSPSPRRACRYIVANGTSTLYEMGYISLYTAAAPGGPWTELRALGWAASAARFPARQDLSVIPALAPCAAFTEPGAVLLDDGAIMYLALGCVASSGGAASISIHLLASVDHARSFAYVGELLSGARCVLCALVAGLVRQSHVQFMRRGRASARARLALRYFSDSGAVSAGCCVLTRVTSTFLCLSVCLFPVCLCVLACVRVSAVPAAAVAGEDALCLGYAMPYLNAADLFVSGGRLFLSATPAAVLDVPAGLTGYAGCLVFEISNVSAAAVARDASGGPIVAEYLVPDGGATARFSGACTYAEGVGGGFLQVRAALAPMLAPNTHLCHAQPMIVLEQYPVYFAIVATPWSAPAASVAK